MRLPFDGDFRVTQKFSNKLIIDGRDVYSQWGLRGHNGVDWGTPSGTRLVAPHYGKVVENSFDKNGYGWYIKIENKNEGSILAHMRERSRVKIGESVDEGQFLGYADNSGLSTANHVHWGYFRYPRNRQNGYNGYIDQLEYLEKGDSMSPEGKIEIDQEKFEDMVTKSNNWDVVAEKLRIEKLDKKGGERAVEKISSLEKELLETKQALVSPPQQPASDLVSRFTSRKFILAVVSSVVAFGNLFFGWGFSVPEIMAFLSPILGFITIEGIADIKSRK